MGVLVEVWRQRIGTFCMPPSKTSRQPRSYEEWNDDTPTFLPTLLVACFVLIMACNMPAIQMPSQSDSDYQHCQCPPSVGLDAFQLYFAVYRTLPIDTMLQCGDIESNPGPALLSESQLKDLLAGRLCDKPDVLLNQHVQQLQQLKKDISSTWSDVQGWLTQLMEVVNKPSNAALTAQWTKLAKMRRDVVRESHRDKSLLDNWNNEPYSLPGHKNPTGPRSQPTDTITKFAYDQLKLENDTLQKEIKSLKEEIANLKCRPSPHKQRVDKRRERDHLTAISQEKQGVKDLNKLLYKRETQLDKTKSSKRSLESEFAELSKKSQRLEREQAQSDPKELKQEIKQQKERILELQETNAKIKDELEESMKHKQEVELLTLKNGHWTYTDRARLCVYELLSLHVSFENVGLAVQSVLRMIGFSAGKVPCGRTVAHMNEERLILAQAQLKQIGTSKNLTLATDETPKDGDIYMTYTVTDENDSSYILGLREMVSKSADDTLTTFKDILNDITNVCNELAPADENEETGMKILCQIKNTMSDRAATETKFNHILKDFREECLPKYKEGWEHFSQKAKDKLITMNNFFCGLHLLISMAETIAKSFKEFENSHLGDEKVGAAAVPGVNVFGSESGSIRLVRTTCKALAKGADEKSGCYRSWNTYLKQLDYTKRYLQNFRGNRFNIVFLLGGCTFFLHSQVFDFLHNTHGQPNGLLKAVHADVQVPTFLAGCKVLGILNKLITAPLWRLIEKPGHILDMCRHFTHLNSFLEELTSEDHADKLSRFLSCEITCFDEGFINRDEVFAKLSEPWEHDTIALPMMRHTLCALKQLVGRVVIDYLPGGKFHDLKDDKLFREESVSVPKHNKLPERVFGYLDFLIRKRPNITAIANEAQVMFVFNRTATFLAKQSPQHLENLITNAMSGRKDVRQKTKERVSQMNTILLDKQKQKAAQLEASRFNKIKRKENVTTTILDAGLWQSREMVDLKMSQCTCESERILACKNQIQFRRVVLEQHLPGDKQFHFTTKGVKKTWQQVRDHLLKFIEAALSVGEGKSLKQIDDEIISVPLLVGKTINHYFIDDDGIRTAWRGKVIGQVPGFPAWFNLIYDNDDAIYSFKLVDDYKENNLEIIPGTTD